MTVGGALPLQSIKTTAVLIGIDQQFNISPCGMECDMYKKQMLIQQIVCYALLAAAVLVFIYSLGIVTDLHYNNFAMYAEDPQNPWFEGAELYLEIQPFNQQLTTLSIYLILSVLLVFVFGSHSRRKYYIGNYIAIGLNSALTVGVSIWGILNVIKYKAAFMNIDFEALEKWQNQLKKPYSISSFWIDAGYYVFAFAILVSLISLASLAFKIYVMHGEKKLLAESCEEV